MRAMDLDPSLAYTVLLEHHHLDGKNMRQTDALIAEFLEAWHGQETVRDMWRFGRDWKPKSARTQDK